MAEGEHQQPAPKETLWVTALGSAPLSHSPPHGGSLGTPWSRPLRAPSPPPPPAHLQWPLSTESCPGFAGTLLFPPVLDAPGSSPPLAALPISLGLWGSAKNLGWEGGLVGFGGKQAFGVARVGFALPWLSPLRCVFGEGERLHALSSSCEANCVSQLVSKWCPRGAATWGATIWDLCSQPDALRSMAPAARGRFALLFHLGALGFGQRGWLSAAGSAFGIFQLFPFPRSFANPKSLSLGCSSLLSNVILGIQQLAL